jgi:hypothetical protein
MAAIQIALPVGTTMTIPANVPTPYDVTAVPAGGGQVGGGGSAGGRNPIVVPYPGIGAFYNAVRGLRQGPDREGQAVVLRLRPGDTDGLAELLHSAEVRELTDVGFRIEVHVTPDDGG